MELQEDVLGNVLRLLAIAEDAGGDRDHSRVLALEERLEGCPPSDDLGVGRDAALTGTRTALGAA